MLALYVYYKVREIETAALAPRVRAMQAALAAEHGVTALLKRRPGAVGGLQTWMEVYPAVPDGFPDLLAQAAARAGLDALADGPRRSEVFVDLDPGPGAEAAPCA